MPVHDWTKVDAGTFHAFHTVWTSDLMRTLNGGLLPSGYYALAEQHVRGRVPDVLTLHVPDVDPTPDPVPPSRDRGIALADAPPRVSRKLVADAASAYRARQRTVTIRRTSGHHVVALLEIVSPGNKDRAASVEELVTKVDSALMRGIHVLVVELFAAGKHDPQGIHGAIWAQYDSAPYEVPSDRHWTVASYVGGPGIEAYVEHITVGDSLPEMPLFLSSDTYIKTPLERTYSSAYQAMPSFWREVLEGSRRVR
jgi:hypothetical protein